MATTTQGTIRQTYNDYCATPDDERYELLNGNLMMVPAPNMKHQKVLVVRHVIIFGYGHGLQRAIIDESQHRTPERLIMAQH